MYIALNEIKNCKLLEVVFDKCINMIDEEGQRKSCLQARFFSFWFLQVKFKNHYLFIIFFVRVNCKIICRCWKIRDVPLLYLRVNSYYLNEHKYFKFNPCRDGNIRLKSSMAILKIVFLLTATCAIGLIIHLPYTSLVFKSSY